MKLSILPVVAVTMLLSGGAWAQTAADTLKDAATQAATQAATDSINKAVGTTATSGKSKTSKQKDGPNWGQSEDHRQDDDNGHKGKNKNKSKKKDRD